MATGRTDDLVGPFTPTFGVTPPVLAGRDLLLADFRAALRGGVGATGRALLATGARGTGKTVLLNALEDIAAGLGWTVISVTNGPHLVEELVNVELPRKLAELTHPTTSHVTSANISVLGVGAGIGRTVRERVPVGNSVRSLLTDLCRAVPDGTGVLLTVDEVHRAHVDQLREVGQAIQHGFREGLPVAFAAAGLGSAVSRLLQDDVSTFLRRAERVDLGIVPRSEVMRALAEPIRGAGRRIGDEALEAASTATGGYPFLIQLVGDYSWNADPADDEITPEAVRHGVERAVAKVAQLVLEPALVPLSALDRDVLAAMAVDDGPSRVRDVARRIGRTVDLVGGYRTRLADADLVHSTGYGTMDFAMPHLRHHIRDQIAEGLLRPSFPWPPD